MLMRALWLAMALTSMVLVVGCGDDDGGEVDAGGSCGNGTLDFGEECDGADLGEEDCLTLGWTMGTLACAADCTFDISVCVGGGPSCGNWEVEYGEDCDTTDLGGGTCESVGMSPGTLACRDDCTYDKSGCGPAAGCGNGIIDGVEGVEECDGVEMGGVTCESLGYLGGELACATNCVIHEGGCFYADCGNGVLEGDEECDTDAFGDEDCVTFGHYGGDLQCTSYCLIDDSLCTD